jgi:flagellar biosynthesis chaperone FliJ
MKVENKPSVNKKIDYKMLCMQLQEEIDAKTDQIASLEIKLQESVKRCPR